VYHGLYSEAVVSSIASAVALAEVGRFREAVEYAQKAAKALYEAAKEVFEQAKVTVQRLVELFVEAVARVLAWVDEHKAYLFLMVAVAAGMVALSVALNMWGLVELEKLAYAASAPFVAGLADVGEKMAERFGALGERYERWRVDESLIDGVLKGERSYVAFLNLAGSRRDLPPPLVEMRRSLARVKDEAERDAAVVAALVLYKVLVKNAGAYKEWAEVYHWARGLVKEREFAVKAEEVKRLREAHRRLEEAAEEVRRELDRVLALYASHSRELYEKLRPHLEVDLGEAEGLAEARSVELSKYSDAGLGTKAYAALLSVARGGIYGHVAMLLMGEGALADIMLSAPVTAYEKANDIAGARGEAVDPSRSRRRAKAGEVAGERGGAVDLSHVGAAGWEDRAASVLLRFLVGYGEADLKFIRVEKEGKKGFQVFRTYGSVEAFVGELWIGKTAYFKVSEEELGRLVEEAKRTAPDLSGFDKAPQYLEWRTTDMTTSEGRIEAGTVHSWQLRWYFSLLGEEKSFRGSASVTKESIKPAVIAYWPREREDQILGESRWLKSLLNQQVGSWRQLVDAIDWSWVLEKVEELVNELKPWIGRKKMNDTERERLVGRMLGELALLVHFAEARKGLSDDEWREERVKRLAKAVEALSGGRITGKYADELAQAIIRYADGHEERRKKRIENLAEEVGVSKEEVWGIVEFVLSDMYCLARDCARDEVVRKFVAPALELIMLDKALNKKFNREEALLRFGEMYATAVAGDGHVGRRSVVFAVGGEIGGGAALLRLATLHLLNQLLSDKLKFNARIYVERGRYYYIVSSSETAARFMRLLAVSAPSAGGEYLSEKFGEFVEEARVEVLFNNIRLTDKGRVAAGLIISEGGVSVKYNVYLSENAIELQFRSTDRGRVELAARLLKLADVGAEIKRRSDGDGWYVVATTDALAAGREELRKALAEIVRKAVENGWVDEKKAERWLEKLEGGVVAWEGKKFEMRLARGALVVRFRSTSRESLDEVAGEFKAMGLEEGVHFAVRWGGGRGYVSLLAEGVRRLAWLSRHGEEEQRRRAAEFLKFLEEKARAKGGEVLRKLEALVEEGRSRGALRLVGLERDGVKVLDVKTEEKDDKLYVTIKAEVDGAVEEYKITFYRERDGKRYLRFYVRGEEAVTKAVKLIEVLTGEKPQVTEMPNGWTSIRGFGSHVDAMARYEELRETIERWSNR